MIFLDICFGKRDFIIVADFTKIIEEQSSEMLLSIMTLLQDKLPCSENFFRFLTNYEKLALEGGTPQIRRSPVRSPRQIASPKYLKSLSPVQ